MEGRKSAGVPEPSSPPRVELSARPSRDASEGSAPASHSPGGKGHSPREEREADPEGGPPEVVTGPVRNSSSHRGTWEWNPPTKGKNPGPKGQGKKGKANFSWPAWGYWVPPPEWTRPKKKNRGLARAGWWAARNPANKGKGKGEGAAAEESPAAPVAPAPEAAAPEAAPVAAPAPSAPAATVGEENNRDESDRALRARELSWANASEELEEARRESSA